MLQYKNYYSQRLFLFKHVAQAFGSLLFLLLLLLLYNNQAGPFFRSFQVIKPN